MNKLFGTVNRKRAISLFLLIIFVSEIITPTITFALTGGPSQPEVTAFTPVNTSEMVDLSSGDFKYNIPLMDVGGYPLNIAYDSGIGMDQEASWVGLGWNLNVGAINRNMRGLPDDFKGETIDKEFNMKDNTTVGVNVGVGIELFGKAGDGKSSGKSLSFGLAVNYNNYTGIGMEQSLGANVALAAGNGGKGSMNAGLGLKSSASSGLNISPNLSFSYKTDEKTKNDVTTTGSAGIGLGMTINSRGGLKDLSINASYSKTQEKNVMSLKEIPFGLMMVDKNTSQKGSVGSGATINFGASTFVPQIQNSMKNTSVALSFKLGTTIFGLDGDLTLGGYFSNQSLRDNKSSVPAYGYMHSHEGQNADNVLMDFNREKDQSFSRYTKNLPITNQTYDVFSVTGQGIGGAFRPFRSDVGYVFDNKANTNSDSYSVGVDFAATQTAHLGLNISVIDVNTNTGKWEDDNKAKDALSARSIYSSSIKNYEPYYFKEVGEKSVNEASGLYTQYGADEPKRIKLSSDLINHKAEQALESNEFSSSSIPLTNHLISRQKRNQLMSTLTLAQATDYGLDTTIYNRNNVSGMNISTDAKPHHIAEVTALRNDGSRYIYGLPAYNNEQKEITFNSSSQKTASSQGAGSVNNKYSNTTGFVSYKANDISIGNDNGVDNYFNSIKTPAYAHSYLLTVIISPDYVDLTGNGPSDDDFGNYTKFEYEKVDNYQWRMPFAKDSANFNEAGKSFENDDQGNFVAGKKELWFTKKIETKNYIAIFKLGDRDDALGTIDGNGGKDNTSKKTKYIKSIALYSKPEYNADLSLNKDNAVPIKVVHFNYDYSLCTGIPNNSGSNPTSTGLTNQGGKLTLKSIYFTYGMSDKAKFSKYNFEYAQTGAGNNFTYNSKAYDRWGNYKPSPSNLNYLDHSVLNNAEYPYTPQGNKANADLYASAWNLTKIELPSGGAININYESDDYAFVQNRPAMQMIKVLDVSASPTFSSPAGNIGALYNKTGLDQFDNNLFVHFELTEPLTSGSPVDEIRRKYLKDINKDNKYLYFRFLVNLTKDPPAPLTNQGKHYEYVSGYAELEGASASCGLSDATGPNGLPIVYVQLKNVIRDEKKNSSNYINPIAKAAMNFGKAHYNNLVWDASFSPPVDAVAAIKQLASEATNGNIIKTMIEGLKGPNGSLMVKEYCSQFVRGKSWIRLYNPNGHKFGGGSRVKELKIVDNWKGMTGGQEDSEYGQTFTYETEFDGQTISSGVASYEPMLGGDENPFRQPVFMGPNKWQILTPDERFFMEEPFGETFFPSASIVYSKVKVKNRIPEGISVKSHGTGHVVHEFYTAKDYPTLTKHTAIGPKQYKPALGSLLKVLARDYVTASQGYVIKLNDMHGKQKGQAVYSEGSSTPISKVNYYYKTKGGQYTEYGLRSLYSDATCEPNELDNNCVVINEKGVIGQKDIGMDFDAVADFRESATTTIMGGAQINLSVFLVGIFPGLVPTVWPDFSYEKSRFRSAVFTKVVSRYGILEKTTAQDLGSVVTTANLAYDAQTGDVLVTKTKNDFEDEVYSLKYPAFWGYDLMGPAYKNIGLTESNISFTNGLATITNASSYYNVGDELAIGNGNKAWICEVQSGSIKVIDKDGISTTINGVKNTMVLRSGRRNLLGAQMASLTSLKNPIDYDNNGVLDSLINIKTNNTINYKVLNTSAIEYSDQWQTFKGYDHTGEPSCVCSLTPLGTSVSTKLISSINNHTFTASYPGVTTNSTSVQSFSYQVAGSTNVCYFMGTLPSGIQWKNIYFQSAEPITTYSINTNTESCTGLLVINARAEVLMGTSSSYQNFSFTLTAAPPAVISCGDFVSCSTISGTNVKCGKDSGDIVNPFLYGIKGNWRPKTTWSYLNARTQTTGATNNNLDIRGDGCIASYSAFYQIPTSANGSKWTKKDSSWTFTSEISKMTPNGVEVENRDALNRYSSALYGYNESLPIAVASNAQLQEIAFDGFEDYAFSTGVCDNFTKEHHFDFYSHKLNLNTQYAHTGKYSMKVNPNSNLAITKKLVSTSNTQPFSATCNYILTYNDFIQPFSPITTGSSAKRYVLSYWVKEKITGNESTSIINYTNSNVGLTISGGSGSVTMGTLKKSNIIDGWQRYEQDFTISAGASGKLNIALINSNTGSTTSYFDDVRIHPYNSNMKSFVYNPVTLKYTAELDANNFATFYEYDEEGSLVRVKKETEKGVMTIQETKNHTKR